MVKRRTNLFIRSLVDKRYGLVWCRMLRYIVVRCCVVPWLIATNRGSGRLATALKPLRSLGRGFSAITGASIMWILAKEIVRGKCVLQIEIFGNNQ